MTVLQPASWHDVIFMEDFLEDALADFDRICEGVPVSVVDVVFCRWRGWASAGRLDPDWPADFLVSVLLDGVGREACSSLSLDRARAALHARGCHCALRSTGDSPLR
jgi:hypothetical protein